MQLEMLSGVETTRSVDQYDLFIRPQILSGTFGNFGSLIQDRKERAAAAGGMTVEQYQAQMDAEWQKKYGMSPQEWAKRTREVQQKQFEANQQQSEEQLQKLRAELEARGASVPPDATRSQLLELLRMYPSKSKAGELLNKVNKSNPATVALRAGVLLGMKTNYLKVAEKLRFAYLSANAAQGLGVSLNQYQQLKNVLQRIQKIFHGAGGDVINLKKAILDGKGNQDGRVQSLNGPGTLIGYCLFDPLKKNLGADFYQSEVVPSMEQGNLGEVSTAGAMTAAAGTMTALAAVLKTVGKLNLSPAPETKETVAGGKSPESASETKENTEQSETPKPKRGLIQWIRDHRWGATLAGALLLVGGVWLYKKYRASKEALSGLSKQGRDLGKAQIA